MAGEFVPKQGMVYIYANPITKAESLVMVLRTPVRSPYKDDDKNAEVKFWNSDKQHWGSKPYTVRHDRLRHGNMEEVMRFERKGQ